VATSPRALRTVVEAAQPIVERIVWCTVATVGPDREPRCRLMHPIWFWTGTRPEALVSARPTPLKRAHIAGRAPVSCFYWDPAHATVAIDAVAEWVPHDERAHAWATIRNVPEPVGFDPAIVWPEGPETPDCAFLRLTAHRILVTPAGQSGLRWSADR
jgi:hypothetical protein